MPKKIPLDVIRLAGGYKASREGKDRNIATQELINALPAMGFEIDYSEGRKNTDLNFANSEPDAEKTMPPGTKRLV